MKKLFSLSLLLTALGMGPVVFGQSTIPSLGKLMSWANNMSYATFDKEVRKLGFSFDEKVEKDDIKRYVYVRRVPKDNIVFIDELQYKIPTSEKSATIEFSTARVDLISFYSAALDTNKFVSVDCNIETKSNETDFCYQTAKFFVRLVDINYENEHKNLYFIVIHRR